MMKLEQTLSERFAEFHAANPHVYTQLVELARQQHTYAGRRHLGIAQLFEVLRWKHSISTNTSDFKLNNSYRSFYAREIMQNEADLAGVFEIRG